MTRTARSSVTGALRRFNRAGAIADATGAPFDEVVGEMAGEPRKAGVSRRALLGGAGAAAGLAVAGWPTPAAARRRSDLRVAVVGGGAGGLACAHRLMEFGIPSTVFEAQERLGGRVFTERSHFPGATVERGGEFISSEHRHTRRLAASLGLEMERVDGGAFQNGGEEVYWIDGAYYTLAEAEADWKDGKIWKIFKSAVQNAPYPPRYDAHNDEHLRLDHLPLPDWLDEVGIGRATRLGKLLQTDAMVEYGPEPDAQTCLNLIYILGYNGPSIQPLPGTDEAFHIVGGNDRLISRVAADLPSGSVRPGRALERLAGPPDGPYTLSLSAGPDEVFDVVVLAIPFTTLRDDVIAPSLLDTFSPAKKRAIRDLYLGPNAKIHVQTSGRPWANLLPTPGGPVRGNGVTYSDPESFICAWDATAAQQTTTPVLVDFRAGEQGVGNPADGAFFVPGDGAGSEVDTFLDAVNGVFPGTKTAYNGNSLASFWTQHPWSKGAYFSPRLGDFTSFFGSPAEPEGNIFFCGEHTEIDAFGFIEGAVRTGELAARDIHTRF